jgi:hypothetical protein
VKLPKSPADNPKNKIDSEKINVTLGNDHPVSSIIGNVKTLQLYTLPIAK